MISRTEVQSKALSLKKTRQKRPHVFVKIPENALKRQPE